MCKWASNPQQQPREQYVSNFGGADFLERKNTRGPTHPIDEWQTRLATNELIRGRDSWHPRWLLMVFYMGDKAWASLGIQGRPDSVDLARN